MTAQVQSPSSRDLFPGPIAPPQGRDRKALFRAGWTMGSGNKSRDDDGGDDREHSFISRLARGLSSRLKLFFIALAAVACMAAASEPNERLPDPAQEARARVLVREVRCLVCQNESIDDSQADLAADLRRIVRQEIAKGRNDREVRAFLVARYGEFVLLKPPFSAGNVVLWLAPLGILAAGGGLMAALLRRRGEDGVAEPEDVTDLSSEEETRLAALLEDEGHDCAEKTPQEAPSA